MSKKLTDQEVNAILKLVDFGRKWDTAYDEIKNQLKKKGQSEEEASQGAGKILSAAKGKKGSGSSEQKKEKIPPLQKQLSNGSWIDINENEIDPLLDLGLKIQEIVAKNTGKTPLSKNELIEKLQKGENVRFGQDWYESIRTKPKPIDPRIKEYNELSRQYWELDGQIMDRSEPSLPSKLKEKQEKIHKKMEQLKKEIKSGK